MNFKSKKISLMILAITSLVLSRLMFVFFNDPEGPNLLVVTVTAAVVYFLSLTAYRFKLSAPKKLLFAVIIQMMVVIGFWAFLRV